MSIVNIIGLHKRSGKSRIVDYLSNTLCFSYDACYKLDSEHSEDSKYLPSGYFNRRFSLLINIVPKNISELEKEIKENCLENKVFIQEISDQSSGVYIQTNLNKLFAKFSYVITESNGESRHLIVPKNIKNIINIGVFKPYTISGNDTISNLDLYKIKIECRRNNITHLAIVNIGVLFKMFKFEVVISPYGSLEEFNGCPLETITKNLPCEVIYFIEFIEEYLRLKIIILNIKAERKNNIFLGDKNIFLY